MDALRRLRHRRKSKEQGEAFTSFADAESTYRSGSSAWQTVTSRSSATVSRPSDVASDKVASQDQPRIPGSPIEARSTAQASRIQPMLIGISRPSTSTSRPGTAGSTTSMQKALDQAAESVTQAQPRLLTSPVSHLGLKQGRYIDIFAIAGHHKKSLSTYNEEVASRNLDSSAGRDAPRPSYEPASQFQEEVANRNAHQIAAQRGSSIGQPSRENHLRPSGDRVASAASGSYTHRSPRTKDTTRQRQAPENSAYHSRHNSIRKRDPHQHPQLPAIPQERSSEDFAAGRAQSVDLVREAEAELDRAKARWFEMRRQNQTAVTPNVDKPLPASPPQEPVQRASQNLPFVEPVKPLYGREATSFQRERHESFSSDVHPPGRPSFQEHDSLMLTQHSSSQYSNRFSDKSQRSEFLRPPSMVSNPSYRRMNVGNRTIIDFTGDEEADNRSSERAISLGTVSMSSYMQTPVIEDARADAFQRVMPTVVDHSPPENKLRGDPAVPNTRWSNGLEPVLDLDQLARHSQLIHGQAPSAPQVKSDVIVEPPKQKVVSKIPQQLQPPQPLSQMQPHPSAQPALAFSPIQMLTSSSPPRAITFSTISTLTSTSPRSSTEILPGSASIMVDMPQASLEDSSPSGQGLSVDGATRRSSNRVSANIAPLVKIFADVKPDESESAQLSNSSRSKRSRLDSDSGKAKSSAAISSSKKDGKRRERTAEEKAIRLAAKSIIPAGPLDQEPMPGVKTRDFALVPLQEKPSNKRIELLSERKPSHSSLKKSSSQDSAASKSSSSSEKKRSRSSKPAQKVVFNDNPTVVPAPTIVRSSEKREKKATSKKSSKQSSSTSQRSRPKSTFDEEAYKKKHAEANAALLRLQQSLQETLESDKSDMELRNDRNTPTNRALTPAEEALAQHSPSIAAMAMIAAVTSPRPRLRGLRAKASSDIVQKAPRPIQELGPRANTEEHVPTLKTTTLTPMEYKLTASEMKHKPPPSPGEVSLSAFPIPTPRAMSPESSKSPPAYVKDIAAPVRRGSQSSRVSTASAFSIPSGMVPSRMGSLPEHRMGVATAPSTSSQIDSIASIIPPTQG